MPAFSTVALIFVGALVLPSMARAQLPDAPVHPVESDVLEARAAFVRGMEFGANDHFEDARREFVHSYALSGSPVALFNLASTLRSLGLHRDATEAFIRLLANPDLDASIRSRATPMYADVIAHVTRLRLYGELDRATLRIDGGPALPLRGQTQTIVVTPGRHELVADRAGSTPWTWSGTTTPGSSLDLLLDLGSVESDEADSGNDNGPVIGAVSLALGLAVAGVVVGVVLDAEAQLSPRTGLVLELP